MYYAAVCTAKHSIADGKKLMIAVSNYAAANRGKCPPPIIFHPHFAALPALQNVCIYRNYYKITQTRSKYRLTKSDLLCILNILKIGRLSDLQ